MKNTNQNQTSHFPVLLEEVLQYLDPKEGESYLDLTAGYGGHAAAVLGRTLRPNKATLVDRDQNAIDYLRQQFPNEVEIIHQDFLMTSKEMLKAGMQFDLIMADLGVSSPHLDNASRGFSLKLEGPLDMRMDERQAMTAEEIVNSYSEEEVADVLRRFGEEPRANKIARLIVANRPVRSTQHLATIVAQAWPGHSKIHPATRTFQAIRIAVKNELEQLEQALPLWIDLLAPGGRIAIISFHSLEDRLVKQMFADTSGNRYDAVLRLLTKQPITGSQAEIVYNPRARSAKLRAAAKINNQKKGE
jgi:16S rRNA (cytosine1402-N4)-methyltransferase